MFNHRRIPLIGAGAILAVASLIAAFLGTQAGANASAPQYDDNLAMIHASSVRNRNHDTSAFADTAMDDLVIEDHLGPRSDYLGQPGGSSEHAFPTIEGGQFRTSCEFSHFGYDDPIVSPNQPGAAHLHMFWGNTDTNAYSTYDTLLNSGSGTCQGQELNRTGYWAPAMFDASGDVRIPERIIVYYKGYGLAKGRSEVYPPGAAMVTDNQVHTTSWNEGGTAGPSTGEASFMCSNQWRGDRTDQSETIPNCDGDKYFIEYGVTDDPHRTIEMHVKFPNCWNREDPADPGNWGLARVGGWFYSECEERATTPNIEYIIVYPLEVGETTEGWYLSSDVDSETGEIKADRGTSVHADWWGGWHPEVNQMWIDNCVNFSNDEPSGCGMGYLTNNGPDGKNPLPGPALKFRPQYDGPIKVDSATLFAELCRSGRSITTASDRAYCAPNGMPPVADTTTTTAPAPTTTSTTQAPATTTTTSVVPTTTTTTSTTTTTAAPEPSTPEPEETLPVRFCRGEQATIVGTRGSDRLDGTPADDVIWAGPGDDTVRGGGGDDIICLGYGNDVALGQSGDDRIFGHQGADIISGGAGADEVRGGADDDVLRGGPDDDRLYGGAGNDRLRGDGGDDLLIGGRGNDTLTGNSGSDRMRGGLGVDRIADATSADDARR